MRSRSTLSRSAIGLAALTLTASGALAQAALETPAPSPKARTDQRVGVTDFSIEYSSPGVKGRKIWGGLLPYGELWRAGANAATKLTVSRAFTFGGQAVPAGSYAYYATPGESSWTVVLNTNANTGGTTGYDAANNVATVTVTPEMLATSRERLAFSFTDTTDTSANLNLEWDKLRIRVPIQVDTKAHVMAAMDSSLGDAWRPHYTAGRYLLDSGGDLGQALGFMNTSIAVKKTWWNHWYKAQILAKQGSKAEAAKAAAESQKLGAGDNVFENFFKADIAKAISEWQAK